MVIQVVALSVAHLFFQPRAVLRTRTAIVLCTLATGYQGYS